MLPLFARGSPEHPVHVRFRIPGSCRPSQTPPRGTRPSDRHHGDELALAQRSPVRPLTVLHRIPVTHRRTRTPRRGSPPGPLGTAQASRPALHSRGASRHSHSTSHLAPPGRHHPTRSPQQGSSPEPPDAVQARRPSRYSPGPAGHTQSTSPPRTFDSHRPTQAAPRGSSPESSDTEQESWHSRHSRGAARDTPSTSLITPRSHRPVQTRPRRDSPGHRTPAGDTDPPVVPHRCRVSPATSRRFHRRNSRPRTRVLVRMFHVKHRSWLAVLLSWWSRARGGDGRPTCRPAVPLRAALSTPTTPLAKLTAPVQTAW